MFVSSSPGARKTHRTVDLVIVREVYDSCQPVLCQDPRQRNTFPLELDS